MAEGTRAITDWHSGGALMTTSQDSTFRQQLIRDEIAEVQALVDAEQALLEANQQDWAARIRLFGLRGRLQRLEARATQ